MELRGITWDHARGYDPLLAVSAAFSRLHPDVTVSWKKRSLKDFGDYPISKLAEDYDLIMIDHPFMADALKEKLLVVLNDHLTPGYLDKLADEQVGPSLDSYCVDGQYQALPVDAATQVAAANMELISNAGAEIPKTFEEVFALHAKMGNGSVGAAMAPTDIFSTYMSMVAQLSGTVYFDKETGIDKDIGMQAAEYLYRLKDISAPECFEMNPINLLDEMAERGRIAYTPYLYGYTNYSREGFRPHLLKFWDAPLLRKDAQVSTQLGGVGIAISSNINKEKLKNAVAYAEYLASPEIQSGIYTQANGQPAARSAWENAKNDAMTHGFFSQTLHTLDMAFLRPKVPHWNVFQEEAGMVLHRQMKERRPHEEIVQTFNSLYYDICQNR